jgi:hypothetical protein
MADINEHAEALADAGEHLEALGRPPLEPLPPGYAEGREALHRIAEDVLKPKRLLETGNEIALRFTPGGFGTPRWEQGVESGLPGSARVEGTEIVIDAASNEVRTPTGIDPAVAAAVADWFALGTVALAGLIEAGPGLDPEPIRLWPEHFDVATVLGDEAAGSRANFGASPGDEQHPEPYLYVGPWVEQPESKIWNATGFHGAELRYAELLGAEDQLDAATSFFVSHLEALGPDG